MIRRLPPRPWWPIAVMLVLGLVGSAAVLAGVVLLVTGARDQPPAHSPPATTTTTIAVVPEGEQDERSPEEGTGLRR